MKKALQWGLMVLGVLVLVAVGVGIVAGVSSDSSDGGNANDAATKRWVLDYQAQLERWRAEGAKIEAAARRGDFKALGVIVQRIGRDGDHVRSRFGNVPPDLEDGQQLYPLMVDAGDAASEWARIYKVYPPPYDQSHRGLRKAQALSDAVVDFEQKLSAVVRVTQQS